MTGNPTSDAIIIGSGPNGLAAAVTMAEAGIPVTVYERNPVIGGACRSAELMQPGFIHDIGSAVHPLAVISPFFRSLKLEEYGLRWIFPETAMAHPFDDGTAVALRNSVSETASSLGSEDGDAYIGLISRFADRGSEFIDDILQLPGFKIRHPLLLMKFGTAAIRSAKGVAEKWFKGERARGFLAGLGAHSVMDLDRPGSMAPGLVLAVAAHIAGWPLPEGGAGRIPDALGKYLSSLGGTIITDHNVRSLDDLPPYRALLMDLTPVQIAGITRGKMPDSYISRMIRYRYGPGVFKIDWILDEPIPWKAAECRAAATVHIGGSIGEIVSAEYDVSTGKIPDKPFVLLVQPSIVDSSRTPGKGHIVWGYCHVPNNSTEDMTEKIELQIERFAPGFRETISSRHVMYPKDIQEDNPNCEGGDITAGLQSLRRMILPPLSCETPLDNVFLCSAVLPPGAGVHGICGVHAARTAIRRVFG